MTCPSEIESIFGGSQFDDPPIGTQLRRIRCDLGLSQADLAKLAGVRQGTISKMERNSDRTPVGVLQKVCNAISYKLIID